MFIIFTYQELFVCIYIYQTNDDEGAEEVFFPISYHGELKNSRIDVYIYIHIILHAVCTNGCNVYINR